MVIFKNNACGRGGNTGEGALRGEGEGKICVREYLEERGADIGM